MIVDTSAIIAILRDEPEASACAQAIASTNSRHVSAVNYVEAAMVIDGSRNPVASRRFDDLVREARLMVEAVTEVQALAKERGEPILFKGDDFTHTDLTPALAGRRRNTTPSWANLENSVP